MIHKFIEYCESVLDLKSATPGDGYYYMSLPYCVIDSVFSINVKYPSVKNVIKRYCSYYDLPVYRQRTSDYPDINSQHTMSQLVQNMEKHDVGYFAEYIFKNKCRTSTRSGIPKAEAVYNWAKILQYHHVEVFQDVAKLNDKIETEIRAIKGQTTGITWSYFRMLSGDDNFCKPDRQLLGFISTGLQRDVRNIDEAQCVIYEAATVLNKTYPNITVRLLDQTIWEYMSELSKAKKQEKAVEN